MFRYTSNITFLYYRDLPYGDYFMTKVLDLPLVMDQGFAKVFQVNETSFVGIVQINNPDNPAGNTLVSLNTTQLEEEYQRVQLLEVENLTEIQYFEQIPLHSFFFEDKEGHRFEIQQFDNEDDRNRF